MLPSSATRSRAGPTTTSSTGRSATRPKRRQCSPRPTSSSPRTWSTRGFTRRRWRPAARWRISIRSTASLTLYETTQAPHAHRTLFAMVAGIPEHKIRVGLAGHRRRVRQQGGHLSGLHPRRRRVDRHRQTGQVGGGPLGKPDVHLLRPGLHHARAKSRRPRTARSSRCAPTCWPTTARSTPPPSPPRTRPASSPSSPAATTCRPRTARSPASTPTRRPAAWRTRAPSGSPRPCTSWSGWWTSWPASWRWIRPNCG